MANTNVMTSVLYGAPYWNGNTFISDVDYSFVLSNYEDKFKNDFFDDLNKKASKIDRQSLLNDIQDCIEESKKLTWESLGVTKEDDCQKMLRFLNDYSKIEEKIFKWIDKIITAAIEDATAENDFSKRRYEKNFSKYSKKAQKDLNNLITEINNLGVKTITSRELIKLVKSLFLGEGTPTLVNTDSSKYGISGEIGTSISNAIKSILAGHNENITKIINAKLSSTFKDLNNVVTTEIIGTAGEKADTKTVYYKDEKIITLLASVKRKKITNEKVSDFFNKKSREIKVEDSGSIINFFKSLEVKVDLPINDSLLEGFNTYWLNLLYFNQYNDSQKITRQKLMEIRNEINAFVSIYAIIFLMVGKNGLVGNNFVGKIKSKLDLEKYPALLFTVPNLGTVPLYKILEQIYENIKKLLEQAQQGQVLPQMRSQMRLVLRLDGIQFAASSVDKISKENPSTKIENKNIFFKGGGHYVGTKGNLRNKNSIEAILNERYDTFGSNINVKIFLMVPGGALNNILKDYV